MSDIGYRNRNQAGLTVSVNSLEEYVRDLTRAISTPHPPYEALGVKVDGEYRQLNANILQIENEYYSFIRPKRVARSGERPTRALLRAGVEYVEVRALDVSAFDPVGVNQNKLRFLEAFLALCVLKDSPPIGENEQALLDENHLTVARRGREPGLTLWRDGAGRHAGLGRRAARLDDRHLRECSTGAMPARPYAAALPSQAAKLADVRLTPSARLLAELRRPGSPSSTWRCACPPPTRDTVSICIRRTRRACGNSPRRPRSRAPGSAPSRPRTRVPSMNSWPGISRIEIFARPRPLRAARPLRRKADWETPPKWALRRPGA